MPTKNIATLLLILCLGACASLNVTAPKTIGQQIVAADESAAGLINTAALFEKNGTIASGSTTENVIWATIQVIQSALDKASDAAASGDNSNASVMLNAALGSITGLTNALNQAQANKTPTPATGGIQ